MKKYLLILYVIFLVVPVKVYAGRGCCSHHGGVAGCNANGRQICNDGTLSPSCTCTPTYHVESQIIYGCTDPSAKNYNSSANRSDNSCEYYKYGCTDSTAKNYDPTADKDNGKCEYYKYGCTDEKATNYNSKADYDDLSCEYENKNENSNGVASFLGTSTLIGIAGILFKKKYH